MSPGLGITTTCKGSKYRLARIQQDFYKLLHPTHSPN
jgi:hypothetical protein